MVTLLSYYLLEEECWMEFKIHSEVLEVQNASPKQVIDWGVSLVQAPQIWSMTKGKDIKVAVLDTGLDNTHPDIAPNFVKGVDFTSPNPNDFMDRQGHGTHCAGVIAGCDNLVGIVGVAPQAKLYGVKVLGDNGSGSIGAIVKGIDWAIAEKVDIISMSLGTSQDPGATLHNAIKRARAAGIVIVAASGNENTTCGWPAAYPEVIAVGAVDQTFGRAGFSNFGEAIDVVAPGVDVLSTYPANRYAKLSGTSMATPMVAGVIALIQQFCRNMGVKATPDKIVQMITERSVDMGQAGDDDMFGNGLINVMRMIKGNNDGLR
jgi:subtilisin family serine protease